MTSEEAALSESLGELRQQHDITEKPVGKWSKATLVKMLKEGPITYLERDGITYEVSLNELEEEFKRRRLPWKPNNALILLVLERKFPGFTWELGSKTTSGRKTPTVHRFVRLKNFPKFQGKQAVTLAELLRYPVEAFSSDGAPKPHKRRHRGGHNRNREYRSFASL